MEWQVIFKQAQQAYKNYLFLHKDYIKCGYMVPQNCLTDKILGDLPTKPPQGQQIRGFGAEIINLPSNIYEEYLYWES